MLSKQTKVLNFLKSHQKNKILFANVMKLQTQMTTCAFEFLE